MTLLLLWGSRSLGKPALQVCISVQCLGRPNHACPGCPNQGSLLASIQMDHLALGQGLDTLQLLQEGLGCSEHFGLGMCVSEGRSCSLSSAGSFCPWFTKLTALLWNDFLHPWKASAPQLWCAAALSVSDQQLECGAYVVPCNLCLLCLWGNSSLGLGSTASKSVHLRGFIYLTSGKYHRWKASSPGV